MTNKKESKSNRVNNESLERIKAITKALKGKKPSFEPQAILEDLRASRDNRK